MAIGNGSWVTPNTVVGATLAGASWLAQPPLIGIADGAGPFGVMWENGIYDAAVPAASLLEITAASSTTLAGQVVRRTINPANQSQEFIGTVVFIGGIDLGAGAVDFAIVKSIGPGAFFWAALTADLVVVPGR